MKNSSDTIGNRTRDLPVCSVVSQRTESSPKERAKQQSLIFSASREPADSRDASALRGFQGSYRRHLMVNEGFLLRRNLSWCFTKYDEFLDWLRGGKKCKVQVRRNSDVARWRLYTAVRLLLRYNSTQY